VSDAGRVVAVVQARTGSTRLPAKVLRPLGPAGRSVLAWTVRAARAAVAVDDVVVATTTLAEDDAIAAWCTTEHVRCHRGPVDDVLTRFLGAIAEDDAAWVVRLTADCPLLDPALVDATVAVARATGADHTSTVAERTFPRGLDVEVVGTDALRALDAVAEGFDRVHVTSALYRADAPWAGRWRTASLTVQPGAGDLRVTLDTPEDAALLDAIVARTGDRIVPWRALVALLRDEPGLAELNAHVAQKAMAEG
jgi:spore coat polysaccharide biosynthesis protein SpsF